MAGHPKATIFSEAIGLRLKNLCRDNYKNKSDCAKALGTTPQNWSRIEAGRIKFGPDEIYKYAAFFGVDPGWLLTGRGEQCIQTPVPLNEKSPPPEAGEDLVAIKRDIDASCLAIQELLERLVYRLSEGKGEDLDPDALQDCRSKLRNLVVFLETEIKKPENQNHTA